MTVCVAEDARRCSEDEGRELYRHSWRYRYIWFRHMILTVVLVLLVLLVLELLVLELLVLLLLVMVLLVLVLLVLVLLVLLLLVTVLLVRGQHERLAHFYSQEASPAESHSALFYRKELHGKK